MKRKSSRKNSFPFGRYLFLAALFVILVLFILAIRGGKFDGKRRFTVVINTKPLVIFSLEARSKKAILINVPANAYLEIPFGYGSYPAASVFKLGEMDSKRGGGGLLAKAIENTFGVMVDGFFEEREGNGFFSVINTSEDFQKIKKEYFSLPGLIFLLTRAGEFKSQITTDLSFFDLYRFWKAVREIRADKVEIVNLEEKNALLAEVLPDGSTIKKVDKELLETVTTDRFQDSLVREESVTLTIVNATDQERLASSFGRILANLGAHVISKTNAEKVEKLSCLVLSTQKQQKSIIVALMQKVYHCQWQEENSENSQADLKIILGEDFLK